jgi:hypothetical protein
MTCRRSTRENRRFSPVENHPEDFFHGQSAGPEPPLGGGGEELLERKAASPHDELPRPRTRAAEGVQARRFRRPARLHLDRHDVAAATDDEVHLVVRLPPVADLPVGGREAVEQPVADRVLERTLPPRRTSSSQSRFTTPLQPATFWISSSTSSTRRPGSDRAACQWVSIQTGPGGSASSAAADRVGQPSSVSTSAAAVL